MRIVMVAPQIGSAFGQEKAISQSTGLLESAGCEVFTVADCSLDEAADLELRGLSSFHSLSPKSKIESALISLEKFLRSTKPDIVHVHDAFDPLFIAMMAKYAPLIFTPHTVSFSCPSSTRVKGDGKTCEKQSGWSCLAFHQTFRCLEGYKSVLHRAHLVHGYLARVKALKTHARRVFAISDYVVQVLRSEGWSGIEKVPNAVFVETQSASPVGRGSDLVYAARITPLKGLADLLLALSRVSHQRWSLKVCGEGSDRVELEKMAKTLGLAERVQFLGRVEPVATSRLVSQATALVAPNRGPETFGLSVAEACFMGVPVVAARVRGLDEIIRDETEGYLFESGNEEDLRARLEDVLSNPEEARRRASKARDSVRARFSKEQHQERLLKAYEQVLEESLKPQGTKNTLSVGSPSGD